MALVLVVLSGQAGVARRSDIVGGFKHDNVSVHTDIPLHRRQPKVRAIGFAAGRNQAVPDAGIIAEVLGARVRGTDRVFTLLVSEDCVLRVRQEG